MGARRGPSTSLFEDSLLKFASARLAETKSSRELLDLCYRPGIGGLVKTLERGVP